MVVYPGVLPGQGRAFYADNEGHIIQYAAGWSLDGRILTFLSDTVPGQPRFRLTYTFTSPADVTIGFEIAMPGSPESFTPYLTGKARRAPGGLAR
jgi:hypothetical protein